MGRAKLRMELIGKEKSRNITFKKRKEGLIRKLHEFTTLCDVSACMIIYGPRQEKGAVEPEIWPQNMDKVNRIIGIYKAKKKGSSNKAYFLSDFFHDRKRKIEDDLSKLRKRNMLAKYPTWLDPLNFMTEPQLRDLSALLANKSDYVKSRIELLRRNNEGFGLNFARFCQSHDIYSPAMLRGGIELEVINHEQAVEFHPHLPNQDLHCMNQNNSMMMLLMNDGGDQFLQFGSASTSANIHHSASFKHQGFYESRVGGCGAVDPLMYCMPPPPPPPPHVQYNVIPPLPEFPLRENQDEGGYEDVVQYHKGWY